jgi:hypothetical protein
MEPDEVRTEAAFWKAAIHEMQKTNLQIKGLDGRLWWILLLMIVDIFIRIIG